jgi:hypothetical protein
VKPLTEALVDLAEEARTYDVTERVIRRARRPRWLPRPALVAALAASLVVVLGVGAVVRLLANRAGDGSDGGGEPRIASPLITELIESPTRGSLAGDRAFTDALRKEIAGDRLGGGPFGIGGDPLPDDPADLRVLFAGDVPGGPRIAIVATAAGRPMTATFEGRSGASARQLRLARWGDLDAPVYIELGSGYSLLLGPVGFAVEVSERPRYRADGTVERTWAPEPAGVVLRDPASMPPGLRVRLSRAATVLYEGNVPAAGRNVSVSVDPAPLFNRGVAVPDTARQVAQALATSSGLSNAAAEYVVLWSDEYTVDDPNGGGSGVGGIATVVAVTPDGGGPYLTFAFDTNNPPTGRNHPTGAGVMGNPATALIAMRLPHWTPDPPDDLQVIAPPAAVRVEVIRDGAVVASAPLVNGVGRFALAAPAEVTVRTLDAAGAPVAETRFSDNIDQRRSATGEPDIRGW